MATIAKGKVHLEVWDILCPKCLNLFWTEPRSIEKFFTGMCDSCAKAFLDWATQQGEGSALADYKKYRR